MTQIQREDLRRTIVRILGQAPTASMSAEAIGHWLNLRRLLPYDVTHEDLRDAIAVLIKTGHLSVTPDPYGATPYYAATAQCVLDSERMAP